MNGLIGRKLGMTQVFDEQGQHVPVTVLELGPCVVAQRKTVKADGYEAVQLGFTQQKEQRLSKPVLGHFKKNGVAPQAILSEVPLEDGEDPKVGEVFTVSIFEGATHVDVTGVTKGRGFQGVMKRHGMAGGGATHGHMSHRRIGAIGQRQTPG
ncbi:MAG: 50S ribosomal protein L3, partial [Kiritimatiellae bacterium]|nr:50S ribosomal protein L3 [Kiritimatiellia bacterium]